MLQFILVCDSTLHSVHFPVNGRHAVQTKKASVPTWTSLIASLAAFAQEAGGMETLGKESLTRLTAVEV